MAVHEQIKDREEREKKITKLSKIMDHLERAKREESAPLIEAAYQQRLVEERVHHEREQQREVELGQQCHEGDVKEKNRLVRMLENTTIFQERVVHRRQAEVERRRAEREEQISRMIQARKMEREAMRKKILYVRSEKERLKKLHEEKEAHKREEAERRRREEAERKARLDEIAEKQRLGEKKREMLARPAIEPRLVEHAVPAAAAPVPVTATAAPAPGKYVPRHLRLRGQAPPVENPSH